MEVSGIQGLNSLFNINSLSALNVQDTAAAEKTGLSFDVFLRSMLDNINETNEAIKVSQQMQLDVALGHSDDLIGLTLAIEKANASLSFTVQVTNRLLDAYREIMRMQV